MKTPDVGSIGRGVASTLGAKIPAGFGTWGNCRRLAACCSRNLFMKNHGEDGSSRPDALAGQQPGQGDNGASVQFAQVQNSPGGESLENRVILANDRDRRTWAWLQAHVDRGALVAALDALAGSRRPYLSNLCKVLQVKPPADLELPDRDTVAAHLANVRAILAGRGRNEP